MPTPCDLLKDAVEGDEGGLGGHFTPPGSSQAGGGSISALRVTGDPAKGDPGGEAPRPRPRPPTPPFTGVILALRVTGTSHSPLSAGERASLLIDRPSPSLVLSTWSVISYFLRYFSSTSTEQISGFRSVAGTGRLPVPTSLQYPLENDTATCSEDGTDCCNAPPRSRTTHRGGGELVAVVRQPQMTGPLPVGLARGVNRTARNPG